MCYELRFFRKREESKERRAREETVVRESQSSPADLRPTRSMPEPVVLEKREVERALEDVN